MQLKETLQYNGEQYFLYYEEPSECPMCKHAIQPTKMAAQIFKNDEDKEFLSIMYLCNHCYKTFLTLQEITDRAGWTPSKILYIAPKSFVPCSFAEPVETISPQFVEIYNQSLAAETESLNQIAGLGYRKAVEFLVKDFCIHKHPADEEKIKKMHLAPCISEFISSSEINTLATRAAWIGNDEAHYVKRQADRDVSDMKEFIQALVYFVSMTLIVDDAASISHA